MFLTSKGTQKFYRTIDESNSFNINPLEPQNKFSEMGKAYMTEFSRFQYKVDAIVNEAYMYVKDLQG